MQAMLEDHKHARRFVRSAAIGASAVYHDGFLARDRDPEINAPDEIVELEMKASIMMAAADRGTVALAQRRIGPNRFLYIAKKVKAD